MTDIKKEIKQPDSTPDIDNPPEVKSVVTVNMKNFIPLPRGKGQAFVDPEQEPQLFK